MVVNLDVVDVYVLAKKRKYPTNCKKAI